MRGAGMPALTSWCSTVWNFIASGCSAAPPRRSGALRSDDAMLVFTNPGHRTETPTFDLVSSSSFARHSEIATTACFVAVYGPRNGVEVKPAIDAVLTT